MFKNEINTINKKLEEYMLEISDKIKVINELVEENQLLLITKYQP